MLVAILLLEAVQYHLDEQIQCPPVPSRRGRECACHHLAKLLTDDRICQHIFISKMKVKGPSIDIGPLCNILDTHRLQTPFYTPDTRCHKALFMDDFLERLL